MVSAPQGAPIDPVHASPSTSSLASPLGTPSTSQRRSAVPDLDAHDDLAMRLQRDSRRFAAPTSDWALSSRPAQGPSAAYLPNPAACNHSEYAYVEREGASDGHEGTQGPAVDIAMGRLSGGASMRVDPPRAVTLQPPNALSPRPRVRGPLITRVSSSSETPVAVGATLEGSSAVTYAPGVTPPSRACMGILETNQYASTDLIPSSVLPGLPSSPPSPLGAASSLEASTPLAQESYETSRRAVDHSAAPVPKHPPLFSPTFVHPSTSVLHDKPQARGIPSLADTAPSSLRQVDSPASTSPDTPRREPALNPLLIPVSSVSARTATPTRIDHVFNGQNRLLCGGRLLGRRDHNLPLVASLLVAFILPCLWWAFNGAFLWERWSGAGKASVLVFVYLVFVMWTSMLKTAFSNPGIIPRNLDPVPLRKWIARTVASSEVAEGGRRDTGEWQVEAKWIRVRHGGVLVSKWCETCRTYRPPRTSHCRLCDNCVERTDHHCAFLNNCIGQRNYLPFAAFLGASVATGMYALVFSAYHISQRTKTAQLRQWDTIGAVIVLIVIFAFLIPVTGLAAYHAKLIWTNRTTIEMLRPAAARSALSPLSFEPVIANPWARRTGLHNMLAVLCTPGSPAGRESWIRAGGPISGVTASSSGREIA